MCELCRFYQILCKTPQQFNFVTLHWLQNYDLIQKTIRLNVLKLTNKYNGKSYNKNNINKKYNT